MNAEQKKRIAQAVSNWRSYDLQEAETVTENELSAMCSSMAALLQELIEAPDEFESITRNDDGTLSLKPGVKAIAYETKQERLRPAVTLYPPEYQEHHLETFNHPKAAKWRIGDLVQKVRGSKWRGKVVGFYSTEATPIGYSVESAFELGSVQVWPEAALIEWDGAK